MKASNGLVIITDSMTLDEKLAAIDEAIANKQFMPVKAGFEDGFPYPDGNETQEAPVDPASLVMCGGCQ